MVDIFGRSFWLGCGAPARSSPSVSQSLVRLEAGRPARMETDAEIQARNNGGLSLGWGHGDGEKGDL